MLRIYPQKPSCKRVARCGARENIKIFSCGFKNFEEINFHACFQGTVESRTRDPKKKTIPPSGTTENLQEKKLLSIFCSLQIKSFSTVSWIYPDT